MNQGLENYLNKVKELEGKFPGMEPVPWDASITPHEFRAEVEYPALECNRISFDAQDNRNMWWFRLSYKDHYDGSHQWISVLLFRLGGNNTDWRNHRQEILKHVELLSENEILSEMEIELALATYRAYDSRYSY